MGSDSNNKPVVIVHTLTGAEREEYLKEMHEKAMHDRTNELNTAWRKGFEQGRAEAIAKIIAEGRAEGREEGRAEGKVNALAKLVKDGLITLSIAAEKANMTEDEFAKVMEKENV